MKSASVAILALAAGLASAGPVVRKSTNQNRLRSHVKIPYTGDKAQTQSGNSTYDSQSTNWSGAAITSPPSGDSFNSVTGTFTVPQPSPPQSGDGSWYGSAWVGIDGDTVQSALFQAGIQWQVTSQGGSLSYDYGAWIEWIPDGSVSVNDFSMNAGDSITVTCTASSTTQGTCYYTNNSSGQQTSAQASAPSSSNAIQGQNVEWIVEDFEINSGLAPFADYGSDTFTGCSASTFGGQTVDLTNAGNIDMVDQNGNTLSTCSVASSSSVNCNYG